MILMLKLLKCYPFKYFKNAFVCYSEARSAVEFAVKYTEKCAYDELATFRQRSAFTVDFISSVRNCY